MELVYQWLDALGFPGKGTEWLRRHRLLTILALAVIAWIPVILLGWLVFRLFNGV
jgi:hypothetical protein